MGVKAYIFPENMGECLNILGEYNGQGRLIAGGTDLMIDLLGGKYSPKALIDITKIEGFDRLCIEGGYLFIGAGVTHAKVNQDVNVQKLFPALANACGSVGSPQIRNAGTLAGNVVNAQPAADSAIALVALGALAEVTTATGVRKEPVEALYGGVGISRVDSTNEVLTGFKIPLPVPGQVNVFGRFSPRNSQSLPIVNAAISLKTENGKITETRIAIGPTVQGPFRPSKAEDILTGTTLDNDHIYKEAAIEAAQSANFRDSYFRGSSDYRKQLIMVLLRRLINKAANMAINKYYS